jgi:hypothetical protein
MSKEREPAPGALGEVRRVTGGPPEELPLKKQLLWVRVFRTIEELRTAPTESCERYNQRWIVQRLGYLTPAQARQQLLALGAAA